MGVNDQVSARLVKLGTSKVTISSATTTNYDFGTPNDLDLANTSTYRPGDRLLVMFNATSAGSADTVSWSVQDAPDSSGSIGTPATALTDGTLTGGTGDEEAHTFVTVQPGRPWIRCRVTSTGATDTFVTKCTVYGLPRSGV